MNKKIMSILILSCFLGACGSKDNAPKQSGKPMSVTVTTPKEMDFNGRVEVSGALEPKKEWAIASDVSSNGIVSIVKETGDEVKKGDVLIKINDVHLRAEKDRLTAALKEASAKYSLSKSVAERSKRLDLKEAVSKEDLEKNIAQATMDGASFESIRAQLTSAEAKLSSSIVKAPADGIVSSKLVNEGSYPSNGTEILHLVASTTEWRIELSPDKAKKILKNSKVILSLDTGEVEGKVRSIAPYASKGSKVFIAYADVQQRNRNIMGTYGKGWIDTGKHVGVGVPAKAIKYEDGRAFVMVAESSDGAVRAKKVFVTIGASEGEMKEIVNIEKSASVIVEGAGLVKEGENLSIIKGETR